MRAFLAVVLGVLGVLLGLVVVALVWRVVPQIGAGVADTAATVRASVATVGDRLATVDASLAEVDLTLAALRAEDADDPEALRARRRELEAKLASLGEKLREELEAVRALAASVDRLVEALDLPFLDTERRARPERVAAIRDRLPSQDEEGAGSDRNATALRERVAGARDRLAKWRASLDALDADLEGVERRAPRLATLLCLIATFLGLWSLLGQVCLLRSGWRGLRS